MSDAITVTMADVRAARLCMRGVRAWLAHHGFDVREFIAHGLPIDRLEETNDHFALTVCAHARARMKN